MIYCFILLRGPSVVLFRFAVNVESMLFHWPVMRQQHGYGQRWNETHENDDDDDDVDQRMPTEPTHSDQHEHGYCDDFDDSQGFQPRYLPSR